MGESGRNERLPRFGFSLGTAFAAAAGFFAWQEVPRAAAVLAVAGGLVLAAAATLPKALLPLERAWRAAGRARRLMAERTADGILLILKGTGRSVHPLSPGRGEEGSPPAGPEGPGGLSGGGR